MREPKKERDDSYVSANITEEWEKEERKKEEDKGGKKKKTREGKRKKKSKEESFTPCMTRRKFAREQSALAMRFIMRSRKRVHVCTYAVARFRKSGSRQIVLRDKF